MATLTEHTGVDRRTREKPAEEQKMKAIVIAGQFRIPPEVKNLDSFRRWAKSKEFPQHGWFSYLDGELWVDTSMEQLITHNLVKTQYTVVVGGLVARESRGYFFSDRALLTNEEANLSTEPDGTFVSFESIETGRLTFVPGAKEGYTELLGSSDMTLEIVSEHSEEKDLEILPVLYWRAGVKEYWLVDVRPATPRFDIFRHTRRGYVATRKQNGWIKSTVFGKSFKLEVGKDRLGNSEYFLRIKK